MTHRLSTFTLAALALFASVSALAQSQPAPVGPTAPGVTITAPQATTDFIVAVVNSEPITNNDVRSETQRVMQQLAQQRRPVPDAAALSAEVLENLINQKAQLQVAREMGLRVEESAVDEAEKSIALQNQFDVAELRRRVTREGQTVGQFRNQLREQILMQRLREREVESRVRVSELDIDQYLRDQQATENAMDAEINLAQILLSVPETATPVQVDALKARAQRAWERARAGEDFATLVREFSDATADLVAGGQMGLRRASRYPELFVQATRQLSVGDVAALVRSPAGFHILKVIEKVKPGLPTMAVTQSHARHILLVPSARLSEAQARQKLLDIKKQVLAQQADFAVMAREQSQDGSAAQGGDLGWASPGMFVPEFELTMNRLTPGEISDPLVSRFGVHLIQLLERRKASLTPEQQREAVRAMLRDKKFDEVYRNWSQDVRNRAFVELREPPLS